MLSGIVFIMFLFVGFPLIMYFFVKFRTIGKMGCFVCEKDKYLVFKLRKVKGPFWEDGNEVYGINPKRVRLLRYPFGWPAFTQQVLPCALYQREDHNPLDIINPLDWNSLKPSKESAIEVGAALEPRWLEQIARGVSGQGMGITKGQRMLSYIAAGGTVLALLLIFYLISRLGAISGQLEEIEKIQQLSSIFFGVS